MRSTLTILIVLLHFVAVGQISSQAYKSDYLEACSLISKKYIYLERKLNMPREEFLRRRVEHADSIRWNQKTYIKELGDLRSLFADGHFDITVPRSLSPINRFYTLGFTCTFASDSVLIVKKVHRHYNKSMKENDTIVQINGMAASCYIRLEGAKNPQSTEHSTLEIAARTFSFKNPTIPQDGDLSSVVVEVRNGGKKAKRHKLEWQKSVMTFSIEEAKSDPNTILLQNNGYPSLEEIPDTAYSVHPAMYQYSMMQGSARYEVLHLRSFYNWQPKSIDSAMARVIRANPDCLLIDLKDCSGGAFEQLLMLSQALGVNESFQFFFDQIEQDNQRRTGVFSYDMISRSLSVKNIWKGKVTICTNELCGSACDFFVRWMKSNSRATVVGLPPAGRGGGTDDFELPNTQTQLSFPVRERILVAYPKTIEGDIMTMDQYID